MRIGLIVRSYTVMTYKNMNDIEYIKIVFCRLSINTFCELYLLLWNTDYKALCDH